LAVAVLHLEADGAPVHARRVHDHGGVIAVVERVVRPAQIREHGLGGVLVIGPEHLFDDLLALLDRDDLADRLLSVGRAHAEAIERDLVEAFHARPTPRHSAYHRDGRTDVTSVKYPRAAQSRVNTWFYAAG